MSNSKLVSYTKLSPNHSGARTHKIDRITPHCVVGQLTAEAICGCFTNTSRQASCNYGIGKDGKISLCVDEGNRSWCSSSNSNDQRAVTIECASGTKEPYEMTDEVYRSLVKLCVDICKRNGKTKLIWFGDKNKALNYSPKLNEMIITVHRWFDNKSCPGDWLYTRLGALAEEVTNALAVNSSAAANNANSSTNTSPKSSFKSYKVKVTVNALNIRKGPGTNYGAAGTIRDKGTYTIIAESSGKGATKWGKLKSGAGWIALDYTEKI